VGADQRVSTMGSYEREEYFSNVIIFRHLENAIFAPLRSKIMRGACVRGPGEFLRWK
jgi:hypothetical protein